MRILAWLLTVLLMGGTILNPSASWRSLQIAEVPAHPYMMQDWPAKWSPEGNRLLYMGPHQARAQSAWGPAMLLNLAHPGEPVQVTRLPAADPTWHPDGRQIAFIGPRHEQPVDRQTVYRQDLPSGQPVDLLPGAQAGRLISKIHGWVDQRTLAYEDHLGTGTQQLGLVNSVAGAPVPLPTLWATTFKWSLDGRRVAGQTAAVIPESFWLWDRERGMLLPSSEKLPGPSQWFEDWSPDGRSILFTTWTNGSYTQPGAGKATLYRLDLEGGALTEIAKDAVAASWRGDTICYVKWGRHLKLVVANAADLQTRWTTNLAWATDETVRRLMTDRPTLVGRFVSYETGDHRWLVSPVRRRVPRLIYRGAADSPSWSPDGRYLALLQRRKGEGGLADEPPHRLLILQNPHLMEESDR